MRYIVALLFALILPLSVVYADDHTTPQPAPTVELGNEYTEYNYTGPSSSSSTATKDDDSNDRSILVAVLLYIPNRVLDAIDIVKADVGVGMGTGGVVRVTRYAQAGMRIIPGSMRVGLRGRKLPFFFDTSSEIGVSPAFKQSSDREVTPIEVGVGVDAVVAGAYVGVSVDEIFDFLLGFVGVDFKDDDL